MFRMMVVCIGVVVGAAQAVPPGYVRQDANLQIGGGLRVTGIYLPEQDTTSTRSAATSAEAATPTINGFLPYIAIALTDAHKSGEFVFAHELSETVVGNSLNPPMASNYVIGVLDSGAGQMVIGPDDRAALGLTSAWMTGNTVPLGGIGDPIDADVTDTLGVFVAGLQAIDPNTGDVDTNDMTGHWHVSAAALPTDVCAEGLSIPTIVGMPYVAFREVEIRNDELVTITRGGTDYTGPAVYLHPVGTFASQVYPTQIPLNVMPGGATTAAYYPNIFELDFETPWIPTSLATEEGAIPTGGWFMASVQLQEGASSTLQKEFMVDFGAQVCAMRPFVTGQLGLNPNAPDFYVDVLGATCDLSEAPGFWLDSFKIDAYGGPVPFSQVAIISVDLPSLDGQTPLDGIIGTNVFEGRNLLLKSRLTGTPLLEMSDPLNASYYGDFDGDDDVDVADFAKFSLCFNGSGRPPAAPNCDVTDGDGDLDVDIADYARFQLCFSGVAQPIPAQCPLQ